MGSSFRSEGESLARGIFFFKSSNRSRTRLLGVALMWVTQKNNFASDYSGMPMWAAERGEARVGLRSEAHAAQQGLVARVGAQGGIYGIHFEGYHQAGPFFHGLVQPLERLVFVSQA